MPRAKSNKKQTLTTTILKTAHKALTVISQDSNRSMGDEISDMTLRRAKRLKIKV